MIVTLTGTGTSHGIPVIGCECPVCRSSDPHDTRFRCSAYIQAGDTALVIDTGPEFRMQALKYNIKHLDAVLITHSHADHLNGLDDLRIFSHTASPGKDNRTEHILPVYANGATLRDIQTRFSYVFAQTQQGGGKPLLNLFNADEYTKENPVVVRNLRGAPKTPARDKSDTSAPAAAVTTSAKIAAKPGECDMPAAACDKSDTSAPAEACEASRANSPELLCFPLPMKHGALDVIGWNIRERAQTPDERGASITPTPSDNSVASATATYKSAADKAAGNKSATADKADKSTAQTQSAQKSFTYLTDCSEVPDETVQLIQGTEHLVIDGLRESPHPTHFSFLEALECAAQIHPKHVWLTHICHNSSHKQINEWLAINKKQFPELADIPVHAAYDGLTLTI